MTANSVLIAPCGMNCVLCVGYLALEHDVKTRGIRMICRIGCRPRNKKCAFLKKQCSDLSGGDITTTTSARASYVAD